jgi:hypothetical protein
MDQWCTSSSFKAVFLSHPRRSVPPPTDIIKEAGSLPNFKALSATQTDTEVELMIIIPHLISNAFMSCEKRDPANITCTFMSAMGVRNAALGLVSSTSDISLTNFAYALQ